MSAEAEHIAALFQIIEKAAGYPKLKAIHDRAVAELEEISAEHAEDLAERKKAEDEKAAALKAEADRVAAQKAKEAADKAKEEEHAS